MDKLIEPKLVALQSIPAGFAIEALTAASALLEVGLDRLRLWLLRMAMLKSLPRAKAMDIGWNAPEHAPNVAQEF